MEKALETSRFAGLRWEDILEGYFGEELVGKKEQRQQENAEREEFFDGIMAIDPENPGSLWIKQVLQDKGEGYLLLMKHYREQPEKLKGNLLLLLQAIPRLPVLSAAEGKASPELLAVFAAAATGDPHFFDTGTLGDQAGTGEAEESGLSGGDAGGVSCGGKYLLGQEFKRLDADWLENTSPDASSAANIFRGPS